MDDQHLDVVRRTPDEVPQHSVQLVPDEYLEPVDDLWEEKEEDRDSVGRTMFDAPGAKDNTVTVLLPKERVDQVPAQSLVQIASREDQEALARTDRMERGTREARRRARAEGRRAALRSHGAGRRRAARRDSRRQDAHHARAPDRNRLRTGPAVRGQSRRSRRPERHASSRTP